MKREFLAFILVIPLFFLYVFYPEYDSREPRQKAFSIHDDFFTLLGKQTSVWQSYVRSSDMPRIEKFRALYERNKHLQFTSSSQLRIPKVIHVIWIGPRNFPRESVENIRTWVAHHPDWTIKLWTDRSRPKPCKDMEVCYVENFPFTKLEKCYEESVNWGEKSDILRYEILFREGGVYIDHDTNCLRPFHGLHSGYDFYAGLEMPHAEIDKSAITAGIGLIGARPHHPVIKGCIDEILKRWPRVTRRFHGNDPDTQRELVLHRTYIALTHSLDEHIDKPGNFDIVFPASYFYGKGELPTIYSKHFYGGAWEKKSDTPLLRDLSDAVAKTSAKIKRVEKLQILALAMLLGGFAMLLRLRSTIATMLVLLCMNASLWSDEFEHLMGKNQGDFHYVETAEDRYNYDFFSSVYTSNKALFLNGPLKIPKKIHFVWLGSDEMPKASVKNIARWVQCHPDWEFCLWSDRARPPPHPSVRVHTVSDADFLQLRDCFVSAFGRREKADLLRYEILYQHGGLCVDHDVECRRSFLPLHTSYDFYTALHPLQRPTVSSSLLVDNSVVGAKPRHPVLRLCLTLVKENWAQMASTFSGEDKESRMYSIFYRLFIPLDQAVKTRLNHGANRDIVFPVGYFSMIDRDFGIYARHQYGCVWFDGRSKQERRLKSDIEKLERRQARIIVLNFSVAILIFLNFLFIIYFYRKLRLK